MQKNIYICLMTLFISISAFAGPYDEYGGGDSGGYSSANSGYPSTNQEWAEFWNLTPKGVSFTGVVTNNFNNYNTQYFVGTGGNTTSNNGFKTAPSILEYRQKPGDVITLCWLHTGTTVDTPLKLDANGNAQFGFVITNSGNIMQPPNQFNNSTPLEMNNAIMDIGNYSANPPVNPYFAYTVYNNTTHVSVVNNYKATATGPILVTSQNVVTYDEIPRVGTLDLSSNYRSSPQYLQAVALGYKSSLTLSETVQCINYIDKTFQDISGDNGRRAQMLKAIFTFSNSLPDDQKPNAAKIVALYANARVIYPNMTDIQFNNWFMGTSEGIDGDYDSTIWENPNLTFPQQNLPSFSQFKNACPTKYTDAQTLCTTMGGDVLQLYNSVIAQGKKLNTCAIRISQTLNACNITIPYLPNNTDGTKNVVTDKNGKYVIINAIALNAWMRKTFGTNSSNYIHIDASKGGIKGELFESLLAGKNGIYSMVAPKSIRKAWGSGHADLLESGSCLLNCHFYDIANQFVPIEYIDVWILN